MPIKPGYRRIWKCNHPTDPDITLTAPTLAILTKRMWNYYGVSGGLHKHIRSDIRKYGESGRSVCKIRVVHEKRPAKG